MIYTFVYKLLIILNYCYRIKPYVKKGLKYMKNIKKIISVLMAIIMLATSLTVFSTAAEVNTSSTYVADYDTETPVIIVHGMSQNNTYLLDENGEWAKNSDGKYITGWPLNIDIPALLKTALPSLLKAIIFRQDCGLSDALYKACYEALSVIDDSGISQFGS